MFSLYRCKDCWLSAPYNSIWVWWAVSDQYILKYEFEYVNLINVIESLKEKLDVWYADGDTKGEPAVRAIVDSKVRLDTYSYTYFSYSAILSGTTKYNILDL